VEDSLASAVIVSHDLYNQESFVPRMHLALARESAGGGAIFHDEAKNIRQNEIQ
jgi:hypothetical protein